MQDVQQMQDAQQMQDVQLMQDMQGTIRNPEEKTQTEQSFKSC